MYIPYSLLASAFILSFSTYAETRATQQRLDTDSGLAVAHEESQNQGVWQRRRLNNVLAKRQETQAPTPTSCPSNDLYVEILDVAPSTAVQVLCNGLLDIPPATVTVHNPTSGNFTIATATSTDTFLNSTSQTVTEITTVTSPPLLRRAPEAAAQFAVANEIIADVIANGADAAALAIESPNSKQEEAIAGFGQACSCESVAPLTTTVTAPIVNQTSNASTMNGTSTASVPVSITSPASITVIATGSVPPISSPSASSGPGVPIVIGLPFECPKDGPQGSDTPRLNPQFIVGDLRFEYSVLCDTAIADTDYLAVIQHVADPTACAAQCSLVNHAAQRQLCQSATYLPNPGASDGQCFIHGPTSNFARQPGSTTIILTGVSSKADKCQSVDLVNGSSSTTVDTAQLLNDAVTKSYSLSTPGLVTRSETGGIMHTFFSSGYTDSRGYYHYTWYELYYSSTAWWAAYATSWSCTATLTTSWNMALTTAYSTATSSATAGAGVGSLPTPLPSPSVANQTAAGSDELTVSGGTATWYSTGGGGVIAPTAVPGSNSTAVLSQGSAAGTDALTISGGTATGYSIGGGGVIPPSSAAVSNSTPVVSDDSAAGTDVLTVSGGTATGYSIGGGGVIPPTAAPVSNSSTVLSEGSAAFTGSETTSTLNATGGNGGQTNGVQSSGASAFTTAGGLSTSFSIGGGGVIPPTPTNASFAETTSSAAGSLNASLPSDLQTAPASSSETFFLPPAGYGSPTSSAEASLPPNSTAFAGTSGATQASISGADPTSNSTGGASILPPLETSSPVPSNGSISVSSGGSAQFTSAGSTTLSLSTGGVGSMTPAVGTSNSTLAPTASSGSFVGTISHIVSLSNSTGGATGVPPSVTPTIPLSTGSGVSDAIPPPSANISETVSSFVSESSEAASTGSIPPPSVNISLPASASTTLSASLNSSLPSGIFVTSSETGFSSVASGNGVVPPSLNGSATPSPSLSPSLSINSTATHIGTAPVSEGTQNVSFSGATSVILSTGTGGVIAPATNLTTSAPATLTASASANVSSTDGDDFSNSLQDRTGRPITRTTSPILSATVGTGSLVPGVNSTMPPPPPYIPNGGYGVRTSSGTTTIATDQPSAIPPPLSANSSVAFPTGTGSAERPSVTLPPISANSSAVFPISSSSTGTDFSNGFGDRFGRSRSRSSSVSASLPAPTGNLTMSGTAPAVTSNASLPATTSAFLSTVGTPVNSTQDVATGSISVPIQSANSTSLLPTGTAPASTIPITVNASAPIGTASRPSIPLTTGIASTDIRSVSVNSSAPVGTASVSVPLSTGSSVPVTIVSSTANITSNSGTATISPSPTASFNTTNPSSTGVAANETSSFATGTGPTSAASTGSASASMNSTFAPSLVTASSVTPAVSSNSRTEDCPTPSLRTVAHTRVITTISYETIVEGPSTCAPSTSGVFGWNSTLPTGTGTAPALTPPDTTTATSEPPATAMSTATAIPSVDSPGRTYRRSGEIATQEQIDRACADASNIVFNAAFAIEAVNTAFGWTTQADDATMTFTTFTTAPDAARAAEPAHYARVSAAATGRYLTISQPLTLCPGKPYRLTSFNRQSNLLSKCTAEYYIGDRYVYTASPQETFSRKDGVFTAGNTPAEVSQDLSIRCTCDGEGGVPAGTDGEGVMSLDVGDVSVRQAEG